MRPLFAPLSAVLVVLRNCVLVAAQADERRAYLKIGFLRIALSRSAMSYTDEMLSKSLIMVAFLHANVRCRHRTPEHGGVWGNVRRPIENLTQFSFEKRFFFEESEGNQENYTGKDM
jgi:hypothetical protein